MTSTPTWTTVCQLEEIVPNTGVCASVAGKQVAVFRLVSSAGEEEGVFAIDNFDLRSGANVLSRGMVGDLDGHIVVASPIYKNHICLQTGTCLEDQAWSVPTYPAKLSEDGLILVGAVDP